MEHPLINVYKTFSDMMFNMTFLEIRMAFSYDECDFEFVEISFRRLKVQKYLYLGFYNFNIST